METCNDETKTNIMQGNPEQMQEVVSHLPDGECCNGDIKVFALFCDKDRRYANEMEKRLAHKKISLTKGLDEVAMPYGKKKDIIDNYDYVAVIITKSFFEDLEVLGILEAIYKNGKKNKKIVPIIRWKDLYEPEKRAGVIEALRKRIDDYRAKNMESNSDLSGSMSKELRKMLRILEMVQDFIFFAVKKDKKTNLHGSVKLLKYILYDSGFDVADKEGCIEKEVVIQNQIININGGNLSIAKDNATINASINEVQKMGK